MHLDNMLVFMLYIVESCYCTFVGDMIMRCTRRSPQAVYSLCIRTPSLYLLLLEGNDGKKEDNKDATE